jgi:GTPase SAR1 family protein
VVGDSSVGKTNIITRFTSNEFSSESKATIGVEFGHGEITLNGDIRIKIQIWDTGDNQCCSNFFSWTRTIPRNHSWVTIFAFGYNNIDFTEEQSPHLLFTISPILKASKM